VTVATGGKERTIAADDAYLRRSIEQPKADVVKGFPDIMPSIPLKPAEVDAIVEYIEALK
jgi:cytochrome c oxidase subunit II